MPHERSSEDRPSRPRVAGLFGGGDQGFQTKFFDELNGGNIHWRAAFADGEYCSGVLDEFAVALVDWLDQGPGAKKIMVVSDTPAALAAFRARGGRNIEIVIGVSGNPALEDVFGDFPDPANPHHARLAHDVLEEADAAAQRLEILVALLRDQQVAEGHFQPLERINRALDPIAAANTIVIVTNYSNPGWEREVEQTYDAVLRHNLDPARHGEEGDHQYIRLIHRGVSCHYPTVARGAGYNVAAVVRGLERISGSLKGMLTVGDAASKFYRDPLVDFARQHNLPAVWETAAVFGLPINATGTLCFAAPREEMWEHAGKIARNLVTAAGSTAATAGSSKLHAHPLLRSRLGGATPQIGGVEVLPPP